MRAILVIVVVILWLGLALSLVRADLDTGDITIERRCMELRLLNAKYAGASLTSWEKAIKVQMVAWYRANCSRQRAKAK